MKFKPKYPGVFVHLNAVIFLALLLGAATLEFYVNYLERGIGYYLKWQNARRPQLGRIWEKERLNIVAQHKVQSILAGQDSQEKSMQSIESFAGLFAALSKSPSLVVSREKFLTLYYDYPGQWARLIIPPYELIRIDSQKEWDRVMFAGTEELVTVSFIDRENLPIGEILVSRENLDAIQSTRTIQKGQLEEAGILAERIFVFTEFLQVLRTLDPASQTALFPDPLWFLSRNYHVRRVGFTGTSGDGGNPVMFGIEYDTDYYPSVLLIPVSTETANNVMSQIERDEAEGGGNGKTFP